MNVFELIADVRSGLGDYTSQASEVIGWLRQAEQRVYAVVGGLKNAEIRSVLQETVTDTISESRPYVMLPSNTTEQPIVYVSGKLCKPVTSGEAAQIDRFPGLRPAASVAGRKITVYTDDAWNGGTKAVDVSYYRSLRPIAWIGGLTAKLETGGYGVKGKDSRNRIKFTFPDKMIGMEPGEWRGGWVSTQVSGSSRDDYKIEEHESGTTVNAVYVDPTPIRVFYTDPNWAKQVEVDGGELATLHRTSELPEHMHFMIIDAVIAARKPQEVKRVANS